VKFAAEAGAGSTPDLRWTERDVESTLLTRFDRVVSAFSNAPAIVSADAVWTYADLTNAVNRAATGLLEHQLAPGALIGLHLPPTPAYFAAYLAAIRAGYPCLPLDFRTPPGRLRAIVRATRPTVVVVNDQMEARLTSAVPDLPTIPIGKLPVKTAGISFPVRPVDQPTVVYSTSGSTGEPKGVVRDQRAMMHHAMVYSVDHDIGPNDRQSYLYSSQSGASMPDMLGALLNGATLYPWQTSDRSVAALSAWIRSNRISLLHLPIGLFRLLVDDSAKKGGFPDLRVVLAGGEVAFRRDFEAGRRLVSNSCVFVHQLASTETAYITRNIIDANTPLPDGVVPVGRPARGKHVLLLDQSGDEVADGEVGQIAVESAYLAKGYWRAPELTARKFKAIDNDGRERRYYTGDLGEWTPFGLRHVGRVDQQVRVRGHRVELAEVEAALHGWNAIRQVAVVAQSIGSAGAKLVAYVTRERPSESPSQDAMRRYLSSLLPEHMVPSSLVVVDSMPLTVTGKIDRAKLPAVGTSRPSISTTFLAPRDIFEEKLQGIWEKVLGIRPIGVRDVFFDLGGNSLQAMRLIAKVSTEFGETLPQATLLQAPTIEQQAIMLRSQHGKRPAARLIGIQPSGSRIPFFCVSPTVVDVLAYRALALELGEQQPFYALYSVDMPVREEGISRVEFEAGVFVEDIVRTRPTGPITVGGYSHGGIVALEIARELRRRGREVAMLILLDVYGPDYRRMAHHLPRSAYRPLQMIRSIQRRVEEFVPWLIYHLRTISSVRWRDRWLYLSGKARNHLRWWMTRLARAAKPVPNRPTGDSNKPKTTFGKSFRDYLPAVYSGRTAIFRASRQPLGIVSDRLMGWHQFLDGEVTVVEIPGYHDSILFSPKISVMADHLDRLFEELPSPER
jgi:acyl-coenzyme A synthetase/AMP-(fatty) acid ligase/thioesterase domain-containing protein/acyl carrier protein